MEISGELTQKLMWMLNLFENDSGKKENDYRTVYRYADGNRGRRQITLGRGFTEDGGALKKVVAAYRANGGKNEQLLTKEAKIGNGTLVYDSAFIKALSGEWQNPAMQAAQDQVFVDVYLRPAVTYAAKQGFTFPLSIAVCVDSFLHSGRMTHALVASFPERPPVRGGDEKAWIRAYCKARLAWFTNTSRAILRTCKFRPSFFLDQIKSGNWNLECPLNIPEKGRIC